MSDIKYDGLKKGDTVYFARILPKMEIYELLDLHIVSIYDTYCTGADSKTKQTFLFQRKEAEEVLFSDRKLALQYLDKKLDENIGGNTND